MAAVPTIGRASGVERRPTAPEADATRALYERYSRQILNYCVHQLNSREEAEDAVQTTFMNAFRGLKRGVVPEAEQAWLFKIAENVCLSRRRSSWRRGKVESPNDFEVLQEIVPSKHANRADELIGLEDALEAMPENQRRAILLREWQGLSYREIADELELSQAAVETLIFRARRSLAAGLEAPAPPKRRRRISAATDGMSLGSLIAGLKSILTGGAAVKAVAVAVAAGSATAVATQAEPALVRRLHHATPPAATVHVTKQSQATFNSQAAIVAGASGMTVSQANTATHKGASLHDAIAAAPLGNRRGHARGVQTPADGATQPPPMIPAAPSAPAPSAPVTPAPEAPIGAAPAQPAAAPEHPKSEPSGPGKSGNGNEGKGNGDGARTDTPKTDTPKADAPKSEPTKGDDDKAKDTGGNEAPKTEPKAVAPTTGDAPRNDAPKANDDNKGDKDKPKGETPKQQQVPVPTALAPVAPAAPAPPAAPTNNGNGNGADKDTGKSDKADPPAPAAAPPVATNTPAAPPVPSTNSPMHGNGNGGAADKDKADGKDKGKGK